MSCSRMKIKHREDPYIYMEMYGKWGGTVLEMAMLLNLIEKDYFVNLSFKPLSLSSCYNQHPFIYH